jgi:hypothetical protein
MSVLLTACHRANSDFPCRARKILIGPFSSKAGRTLHRPWNSMMRQLHDENGHREASIDCTGTEPIVRCRARYRARYRARCRAVRRALTERLHRSHDWSKSRIKPEPRYQHVTVTESSQSSVVKLEPSVGPTLFLIQTTADRSSAAVIPNSVLCQLHDENGHRGKEGTYTKAAARYQ